MQGKVSMVMPCYNKVEYIAEMFDSIIAQEWNNIELILVNDGSTDGTREVITEYEPKFKKRGFEVVIINQENQGVCAAAKAGLEQVTGEFVCMVDADDELDPKYVSTMAEWLEENPEHDIAACEGIEYTGSGASKAFSKFHPVEIDGDNPFIVEKYMLVLMRPTVWIYMVRSSYLRRCRIIEAYYTRTKGSHEPGYIIPLLSFRGKLKFFSLPLYLFNDNGEGHSRFKRFEQVQAFCEEYEKLCNIAIDALPEAIADTKRKQRLKYASKAAKYVRMYRYASTVSDGEDHTRQVLNDLLEHINKPVPAEQQISITDVFGDVELFLRVLNKWFTGGVPGIKPTRIIAWGVLGKRGKALTPLLLGTGPEPIELWDALGDGVKIKKPNADNIKADDLVLIMPVGTAAQSIYDEVKDSGCAVVFSRNIADYIDITKFPRFFKKYEDISE